MGLRFFADPVLRFLTGREPERPLGARLSERVEKPEGLRCFFKGAVEAGPDGLRARCLPGQGSFQIRPLLEATHWVVLPEKGEALDAGAEVEAYPL